MIHPLMHRRKSFWFAVFCLCSTSPVLAGISGENIVVVVNGDSTDSLTLANHYVALRDIPPSNVIVLDDIPSELRVSLDTFRDSILKPVLERINERGLASHTRVIAYSAGFPTAVNISSHTQKLTDPNQKKYQLPVASINSLTFFYRWVLSDSSDYLGWGSNLYARGPFERHFANPFGGEDGASFTGADKLSKEAATPEQWIAAAKAWGKLADKHPTLHSMNVRAAEAWANAGESDAAIERLASAIRSGWINRRYVEQSETLQKIDRPDKMAVILKRLKDVPMKNQGPVGFAGDAAWTATGHAVPMNKGGMPYLLSCVLGVVHERGSTLDQAIDVLKRAKAADRTYPKATVGFAKTSDVRVTTREPLYPDALAWLLSQQRDVEIFSSKLPTSSKTYVGLMLGSPTLVCRDTSWQMVPGAIAENLTSLGAAFETGSQTKLTELLHAGAAISSGAVAEPYSLTPKFPTPMMHAYYAEGVSAIEAFYLTTTSPYQLLIVGDPACQPFARPPTDYVRIESGTPDDEQVPITVAWQTLPAGPASTSTAAIELYLQDKRVAVIRPTKKMDLNLPAGLTGEIRCRAVLVGDDVTQPRIATSERIVLGNPNALPTWERVSSDEASVAFRLACPDADRIELLHFGRVAGETKGVSGSVTVPRERIGNGPVRLQAVGYLGDQAIPGSTDVLAE